MTSEGLEAGSTNAAIREPAPAKVNLTLRVTGRRADGYHELESLVVFASAGDVVTLTLDRAPAVTVKGRFAAGITGENLLTRTLDRLASAEPRLRLGAVTLEKVIPVAAGLGGGSADAAALLRAVRRANPDIAPRVDWHAIAAGLGADVPVCLTGETAVMWGIGERVLPLSGFPRLHAVLVHPGPVAPADKTAQVFRRLATHPLHAQATPPELPPPFQDTSTAVAYVAAHGNDLAAPARALMPAVGDVEAALAGSAGCLLARMSGAGPSCFGLYASAASAHAAAEDLTRAHPAWWVANAMLGQGVVENEEGCWNAPILFRHPDEGRDPR